MSIQYVTLSVAISLFYVASLVAKLRIYYESYPYFPNFLYIIRQNPRILCGISGFLTTFTPHNAEQTINKIKPGTLVRQ